MDENNVLGTEQQETAESTPQEEVKTFTQEEVDKIVEKRLNRERRKLTGMLNGEDPREASIMERERAVTIRELRADTKDMLLEKGLPMEAFDLLDYTDKESCVKSIETLEAIVEVVVNRRVERRLFGDAPIKKAPPFDPNDQPDKLRAAFRP